MTATVTADQMVEEPLSGNSTEAAPPPDRIGPAEELANLLAQAYAAMPLFA
ncbi:MAG: hypothetical protein AB1679_03940 [Actinomycetota bacterium]|jgi:hypothetical protein